MADQQAKHAGRAPATVTDQGPEERAKGSGDQGGAGRSGGQITERGGELRSSPDAPRGEVDDNEKVDEASEESFPGSDAPSWSPSTS